MPLNSHVRFWLPGWMPSEPPLPTRIRWAARVRPRGPVMRGASLERASHGSLLDSLAFEALRDRGTTRGPTIPRQGSGRRVSVRLAVTRPVIAGGPLPSPERNSQATRNRETIGGPRAGTEPLVHPRLPRLSSRRVAWRIHESLAPFADSRSSRSEE